MSKYNYSLDLSEELGDEMAQIDATISEYGKISSGNAKSASNIQKKDAKRSYSGKTKEIKEVIKQDALVKTVDKKAPAKKAAKKVPTKKAPVKNAAKKSVVKETKNAASKENVAIVKEPEIAKETKPIEEAKEPENKHPGNVPPRAGMSFKRLVLFVLILVFIHYGMKAYAVVDSDTDPLLQCSTDYITSVSDTPIILSGASEAGSFWIQKAFVTENYELADNIFNMLSCEDKLTDGINPYQYEDCAEKVHVLVSEQDKSSLKGLKEGSVYNLLMGEGLEGYTLEYVTEGTVIKVYSSN